MSNIDSLKPFAKGKDERRNMEGRPVGARSRSTIVKYWLETINKAQNQITGKSEDLSIADQITLAQVAKARKGDTAAYKELMDAAYGKLIEKAEIDHSGNVTSIKVTVKKND